MARALPQLRQLTHLVLDFDTLVVFSTARASLPQLHSLLWNVLPLRNAALPPGPWLAQLHTLTVPWELLQPSLPAPNGAARLQKLGLLNKKLTAVNVRTIMEWATEQPRLQLVALGAAPDMSGAAWRAVAAALRRNPALVIESGRYSIPLR